MIFIRLALLGALIDDFQINNVFEKNWINKIGESSNIDVSFVKSKKSKIK